MTPHVRHLLVLAVSLSLVACDGDRSEGDSGFDVTRADRVLAEASQGPVRVQVRTDAGSPRFGDRLMLVVEVTAGDTVKLTLPEYPARIGHFLRRGRHDPQQDPEGPVVHVLEVQPERTGPNIGKLPPVTFDVVSGEGAGSTRALEIPAFEIEVLGLDIDAVPALADAGQPLPPVPLPADAQGRMTLWVALVGGALLAILFGAGWLVRRRPGTWTPPPVDPAEEAREALDALLREQLVEQGRFGEFYVALTGIVRIYIERTTGINAPDLTTEEFLHDIDHHGDFPRERQHALQRFLEAADLVKYAAQVPQTEVVDASVHAAYAFCGLESQPVVDEGVKA